MVHSHLSYCLNAYSCANTTNLQRLRIKQKEAVRIISNAGYRDHTKPLFLSQKILPLDDMVKFANLKFMHSYIHHRLPFSFSETWTFNRDRNPNRQLRNANELFIPAHNYATIKRFPLFTFPRIWNEENDRKFIPSLFVYGKPVLRIRIRIRTDPDPIRNRIKHFGSGFESGSETGSERN
jgi:hypothetical protein